MTDEELATVIFNGSNPKKTWEGSNELLLDAINNLAARFGDGDIIHKIEMRISFEVGDSTAMAVDVEELRRQQEEEEEDDE